MAEFKAAHAFLLAANVRTPGKRAERTSDHLWGSLKQKPPPLLEGGEFDHFAFCAAIV